MLSSGKKGFKEERQRLVKFSNLLKNGTKSCKHRAVNRSESDLRTRYEFSFDVAGYSCLSVDRLWRAMDRLDSSECASSTSWDGIVVVSVSDWMLL